MRGLNHLDSYGGIDFVNRADELTKHIERFGHVYDFWRRVNKPLLEVCNTLVHDALFRGSDNLLQFVEVLFDLGALFLQLCEFGAVCRLHLFCVVRVLCT